MSIVDPLILQQLYVEKQLSIRDIASLLRVNPRTVHTALIRSRIARRQSWEHPASLPQCVGRGQLDEARLRHLYTIEQLSIREIANQFNTCTATIHHALVLWNIPRRKRGRPNGNRQMFVLGQDQETKENASVSTAQHAPKSRS